jgi:RNA polymerase sporulation-specific sigma factor
MDLSREEEWDLVALAKDGNVDARSALVRRHLGLARRLAIRHAGKFRLEREDLASEAVLGLLDAIRDFDQSRGVRFITFACWKCRGRLSAAFHRAARDVSSRSDRWENPSLTESGGEWNLDGNTPTPPELAAQDEARDRVLAALNQLSDRERRIVKLRFWEGMSMSEIGEVEGKTKQWVQQVLRRIAARLRASLEPITV